MSTALAAHSTPRVRRSGVAVRSNAGAAKAALAGTFAVCLALGAGRWGSYLGHSPIYLTDVLFISACLRFVWLRERESGAPGRVLAPTGALTAFAVWAFVRFAVGGRLDLVALRDAVPYAYALGGVVSGAAIARSTEIARARTARFLTYALAFHAAWFFLVTVVSTTLPTHLPTLSASMGIRVLSTRVDFDTAMVGVYAAILLSKALRRSWTWPRAVGIGMCVVAMGASQSRAGVLGGSIAIGIVLLTSVQNVHIPYRARMALVGCMFMAVGGLVVSLPFTLPGQRLLATVGIMPSTYEGARAVGTVHAREGTWVAVARYSSAQPLRLAAGVGFGADYLRDSGAIYDLTSKSDTKTRAPHSWWVDVQARLGLVGLVLWSLLALKVVQALRILAPRGRAEDEPLLGIAGLTVAALIPPLSFGVIMESPFGAVPFYWCAGVVLGYTALFRAGLVSRRQARSLVAS